MPTHHSPSTSTPASSIALHDASFAWPDGRSILTHVTAAFPTGRTGLIGDNGAGKSTALALLAGRLQPTDGRITRSGVVACLPQRFDPDQTVAELLGVRAVLDAIAAVERGGVDPEIFERIGDDWDIEARSSAALAAVGVDLGLDRTVDTLSGGEAMLAAIVGVQLAVQRSRADIALLDEPTNNLDTDARQQVYRLIDGWRGALIVVSHDRQLLEHVDAIAELRDGRITLYGGAFSAYEAQITNEQQAAEQALRSAEQELKAERRQRTQAEQRIAHSARQGRKDAVNRKFVKAVVNDRRNSAEKSQAARRGTLDDRVNAAQRAVDDAESRVRDNEHIVIELPDPDVPVGRRVACLTGADGREFVVQGPERVALTGPNGVGKSTLLGAMLCGQADVAAAKPGGARAKTAHGKLFVDHVGYLSQQLASLHDDESVVQNVARFAPGLGDRELRNQLARLLLRGRMADAPVVSLSGGERFRVALAQVLLATPAVQALVLDEPTNSLDMASVDRLVEALDAYRGAVIVVSHDRAFLERLRLDVELRLDSAGVLTQC
ncbi:ABC-F family ATP-binding cassette domain-containing protein [Pseudoclavibacter sp. CFCC 13796]|uniref:ABC-F family ATP-binding cassette domain-containing protein n=1 Tax=Pseudoclavibacter sp. CFCC 13796 TaxID=2615179 RepID=UPI001300F171|nr:ABC-F family ATP-binding cassette domain-containing protein [Pseudoclavibacter sp. CFCC 13796]KAB1659802.1 ABC-F family ATP-binding cassette domain-containing protein [Pseudoclavibacter sp. CFCC 13796]